ncbi:MAG: exostosin family protein [Microcoleaceae cyanobacterium]
MLKQSDAGGCIKEVKFISCRLAEKESVYIRKIPKEISKMEIHPYGLKSGPNLQFFRSLQELMASESEYTSVLLQEVDTIPLKVHWIDSINKEIAGLNNALLIGTNYSGASRLNSEQVNHINGNAIYCLGNPAFKNFLFLWEILVVEVCKKAPWNAYDTATEWAIEYIDDDSRWTLDRKKCQDSPYFQSQEFRQYLDLYHTNTHKLNQLVNKAGPFELMVCTVLEPSAIADQLRAASVLHLRPALPFRDICRYVANDHQFCGVNVIGHDALWQYPAITEQYAYEKAKKYLRSYDKSIVYFGFPWATLIDYFLHKPENAPLVLLTLERYKPYLKQFSRVITVCQHIHLLKFQYLFSQLGITDIFWCHAVKGQSTLPNYFDISLHPFPLYPVQACNASPVVEPRKYLFSFVGSYAPNYYLTDSRNKIIDFLSSDDRGLVISRDQWHYQKVVYDHQVKRSSQGTDKMIDTSASEQFQTAMKQSKFALCPSGSGPNSIRLWEAIGLGAIPVVLADTYLPPGDLSLWDEATITCRETLEDIKALPDYLAKLEEDPAILERKRHALRQLWMIYGPDCFIYDIINHFLTLQQLEMTNNVA